MPFLLLFGLDDVNLNDKTVIMDKNHISAQGKVEGMFKSKSDIDPSRERERNVLFNNALNTFYLRLLASDIWLRTIPIVRKETRCCHISYSFRLAARVLLYAPSQTG